MTLLLTLAAAAVAIGVLVTVHEYGHYIVARKAGIKVLRFSVGFGKPLWRKVSGPDRTEYQVAALPLGGYVKMLDARDGPVPAADRGRAFTDKSPWARIAVLVAGPMANFIFAIATFWIIFMVGVPDLRAVVGSVAPDGAAERAGLVSGDEILAVNGTGVDNWGEARVALLEAVIDGSEVALRVRGERAGERDVSLAFSAPSSELTEPGNLMPGLGFDSWRPPLPALVGELSEDGPAASAGLMPKDQIVAIDGEPITTWDDMVAAVTTRPGQTVTLTYRRQGAGTARVDVPLGARQSETGTTGFIGIVAGQPENVRELWEPMIVTRTYAPLAALSRGASETVGNSVLMLKMFYHMLIGKVSFKNISGPISIAQFAGITAQDGPVYYLRFLALLSISLGVLNLLPIPMLDGGQVVYQLAEVAKGSPVSMRTEIIGQQIGMAMLFLLMSFAVFQDIGRFTGS